MGNLKLGAVAVPAKPAATKKVATAPAPAAAPKAEKPQVTYTRRAFLATLQGDRCLFSADDDCQVLAIIATGQSPKDAGDASGVQIVPRKDATDAARLTYAKLWRAEHGSTTQEEETPAQPAAPAPAPAKLRKAK